MTTVDYYMNIHPVLKGGSNNHKYPLRSNPLISSQMNYQDISSDNSQQSTSDSEYTLQTVTTVVIHQPAISSNQLGNPTSTSSICDENANELDTSDYSYSNSQIVQWFPDLPIRTGQEPNEFK